ncbi:ankyrin repeat domain-containing protein [bacterium]|nr:ankyrin repeat domain-containing protein [bacterium]
MPVLTHAQEDQYRQSLADAFIIKTADGILPSPLYYSMVLQATLPEGWSCGVEAKSVGPEQKQILFIKDKNGQSKAINYYFAQWKNKKEDIQKRMSEQTGMSQEWLDIIRLLFARSNADGLDLCLSLAQEGCTDFIKDDNSTLDREEIKRQCDNLQPNLLVLGAYYQQVQEFILKEINPGEGYSYYEGKDFPCQHELIAEIIRGKHIEIAGLPLMSMKRFLYWLIQQGCVESLKEVFNQDPGLMNSSIGARLSSPLMLAIRCNQRAIVELLLEKGADVNAIDSRSETVLMHAADEKDYQDIVKVLLEKGADVKAIDSRSNTALMHAAINDHQESVKFLLDHGAEVNAQDENGWTALVHAAYEGHQESVKLLLKKKGADVNVQDTYGKTALMLAAEKGHQESVKLLLERGADVNVQDKHGLTALMIAGYGGHQESVKLLIEMGAEADPKKRYARAAEYVTSLLTDEKTFEYLAKALERNDDRSACVFLNRFSTIDLSNPNIDFKSLLFKVAAYGKPSTLDLLMKRSSRSEWLKSYDDPINRKDQQDKTALHHAIEKGNVEMIDALVKKYRADVHVKDKNSETPIALAERLKRGDIVELLRNRPESFLTQQILFFRRVLGWSKDNTDRPDERPPEHKM